MSHLSIIRNRAQNSSKRQYALLAPSIVVVVALLAGCDQQPKTSPAPVKTPEKPISVTEAVSADQVTQAEIKAQAFKEWLTGSFALTTTNINLLSDACDAFYQNPNDDTLTQVKQSWQQAHAAFSKTALLFSLPKASPDLFYTLKSWQNLLDAYTVEPGYLDSFDVYTHSGIVNDTLLTINAETVRKQHQLTHSDEIALGFHALEFLIWGDSDNRPVSMFIADEETNSAAEQPENRRRDFVRLLARLLLDDYKNLHAHWQNSIEVQLTRLSPLSQVQLWKQALAEYWREHAIELLRADQLSGDIAHTRFAGETASQHVLSSSAVISDILTSVRSAKGLYAPATQKEIETLLFELSNVLAENVETASTIEASSAVTTTENAIEQAQEKPQALALSENIYRLLGY